MARLDARVESLEQAVGDVAQALEGVLTLMRLKNPKDHGYRELFEATEQILQEVRGRVGRLQLARNSSVALG